MSIGYPDYQRPVQPAITERRSGQTGDYYLAITSVGALSINTITIGTGNTGENWLISKISVSSDKSWLMRVDILHDSSIVWTKWGDVAVDIDFQDPSIRPVASGVALKVAIWNYDTSAHNIWVGQQSTRVKV